MKFNDFFVGQTFKTKSIKITKENIKRFAAEFDPQYMHLDEDKAMQGRFNGIIASGIQTLAVSFKLWVETGIYGDDVIAGTAFNNIRFIKPVYPEDELHTIVEVTELREKRSETGIVTVLLTTFNDKEEKVFEGELSALVNK
ncbi:acyl dehydratase [Paenibacillus jamilae]|jgi:acyl dehydratase|uniref:MaoC family dehydratase n=1 Tax=Paenibacillus TaxID=44249 RepID=UPI000D322D9E|nr:MULTISPECIES: MaoC family dehydratase [Paenibacillus]MDP9678749.1 acyl dehydratase [Paenibacillus jamilae]KAF6615424.1 MaoC family dehydratase [Paenibacillus sp. EKM101P]KAF6619592.1 MaoC family dehydratase [Paenibacillus sp. EKM102P]KAF6627535.1 MaoC family dehydratase [Paenibacillus sp. EKM10P]KAF6643792.1 MaoC family dehydratase [Paenibacillus sp. EKM11P]